MPRLPERIATERLLLRQWEPADAAAMGVAISASIEHLRPWMAWIAAEPLTDAERTDLVASWRDSWEAGMGEAHYGVFDGSAVIGSGGLRSEVGPGGMEIGYWIHADHVRQGYATEVARALTTVALGQTGVERVEIRHDMANVASAGVPNALGYRRGPDRQRQPQAPAETGTDWVWIMTGRVWDERAQRI
ncbi:MAG: GNAT family N-acetyltransferase [Actinomycetota bacterium]